MQNGAGIRRRLTATCAAFALAAGISSGAQAQVIIDNGTVLLGVNPEGNLITAGRGLTFLPTDTLGGAMGSGEALAPGCDCEGWGIRDLGGTINGKAGQVFGDTNLANAMVTASGMGTVGISDGDSAVSTVDIVGMGGTYLNVRHGYAPSASPNLYQVDVRITNVSGMPVTRLVYRRAMDWDVPPTEFNEVVTIQGAEAATRVIAFSDDGFVDGDPSVPLEPQGTGSPPANTDFVDNGPSDHGAAFDFDFGTIADGDSAEFTIFYGAAASEADALAALGAVGAEVYSFGQPAPDPGDPTQGPDTGQPNTFIFAFAGVGGTPIGPGSGISNDVLALIRDLGVALARQRLRSTSIRMDGLDGGGAHRGAGYTPPRGETAVDIYGIEGLRMFLNFHAADGDVDQNGSNIAHDYEVWTLSGGVDKSFDFGEAGFLGSGLVGAALDVSHGSANGTGSWVDLTAYGGSIYGGVESNDGFYADGSAGYTHIEFDTNRSGLMANYRGDPDANLITGKLNIGYDFPARLKNPILNRSFSVGPYASLSYTNLDVDGFMETNNGLTVDDFEAERLDGEIGVRGQAAMEMNGASAFAKARVGVRHDFLNDDETVTLWTVGGATGQQVIESSDETSLVVGLGLGAAVNQALTVAVEYDGMFGEETTEHGVIGRARIAF